MKMTYRVGKEDFSSVFQAWIKTGKSENKPIYRFPQSFHGYDWSINPTQSIEELEDEYAKYLYTQNKKLRLLYSGGTDSHTVAHAFARNKIPIVYTLFDYETLQDDLINSQFYTRHKVLKLEKLHKEFGLPYPKYEVISSNKKKFDDHFKGRFFEKGFYYGCHYAFNYNESSDLLKYSVWNPSEYTNIFGIEKPRLYEDDVGIFWQITDTMSAYAYSNLYDCTWFYLSEHCLPLIAKQCWNVITYCVDKWPLHAFWHSSKVLQTTKEHYFEWCQVLGRKTDLWWAEKSYSGKGRRSTYNQPVDPRLKHASAYRNDLADSWKVYATLFESLKEITGVGEIQTVVSDKFYLTRK